MSKTSDLLSWDICNPANLLDHLPQPYRLIDEVLNETIIHQLQLAMHHIQEKKKDQNYQGKVQQYVAQSLIQIDHDVCCLSSSPKYQNYLIAGDRKGNLLVIDVAKKSLFCKKQLTPQKRITFITQTTLFDGQTYLTIAAVISNNSNAVKIITMKHNDPKVFLTCEVATAQNQEDPNKLPYECSIQDEGRLLVVKTYEGTIIGFCLPQLRLDQQKILNQQTMNQNISNASNSIKKPTIYPLQNLLLTKTHGKVTQKRFQIKFDGYQKPMKYKDLLNKIKNKSKTVQPEPIQANSKKDSKKDPKKVQVPVPQVNKPVSKQILFNQKITRKQPLMWNNNDISDPYHKPKYEPFFYVLYDDVQYPRKKSFQKGRNLKMASKLIYGWYGTKQVYSVGLLSGQISTSVPQFQNIAIYQQFLQSQALINEQRIGQLETSYKKHFCLQEVLSNKAVHLVHKMIYPITCSALALPGMSHVALGLEDGTIAVYDSNSLTLQYNTDKHSAKVIKVQFFQNGWKTVSGSSNGEVHISNFLQQKNQVKRTHIFQAKENTPIVDIKVNNDLGIVFIIDLQGNVRVYDLWRNEKVSRFSSCNSFSMAEGKGKRWIPIQQFSAASTIYTNRDYSVLLSIDWPNIPNSKAIQVSAQLTQRVEELSNNPWKSKQINIHVIRNFQFLLDHFDGLQSVYKKGHEKGKIINLFSNLEFSQLYDRNFDIPDFGRTVNINSQATLNKSNLSSSSKFSNSKNGLNKRSLSKQKGLSGTSSAKQTPNQSKKVKLTTQVLHPEKFLFERRKINDPSKSIPNSNQKLMETIRQQHKKKERRANILQDELNRTSGGI